MIVELILLYNFRVSIEADTEAPPLKAALDTSEGLEKLRDVIAHCIMPPKKSQSLLILKDSQIKLTINSLGIYYMDCIYFALKNL